MDPKEKQLTIELLTEKLKRLTRKKFILKEDVQYKYKLNLVNSAKEYKEFLRLLDEGSDEEVEQQQKLFATTFEEEIVPQIPQFPPKMREYMGGQWVFELTTRDYDDLPPYMMEFLKFAKKNQIELIGFESHEIDESVLKEATREETFIKTGDQVRLVADIYQMKNPPPEYSTFTKEELAGYLILRAKEGDILTVVDVSDGEVSVQPYPEEDPDVTIPLYSDMYEKWSGSNMKTEANEIEEDYKHLMTEAVSGDDLTVYKVVCRDPEGNLKELIEYIGDNGNTGHSFEIVVDPEMTEAEGKKTFYWDGDGSDYIKEVTVEGQKEAKKETLKEAETTSEEDVKNIDFGKAKKDIFKLGKENKIKDLQQTLFAWIKTQESLKELPIPRENIEAFTNKFAADYKQYLRMLWN